MNATIISRDILLLAIPLSQPFRLGFGTLRDLPRVLLRLTVEPDAGAPFTVVGEASIDFPFSHYDAWDIIFALHSALLVGRRIGDRETLLDEAWVERERDGVYATQAAINMALDAAAARMTGTNVCNLYGHRPGSGCVLESVGILANEPAIRAAVGRILAVGRTPKFKCGTDMEYTSTVLHAAAEVAHETQGTFSTDFNGSLGPEEWEGVIAWARDIPWIETWAFSEQPIGERFGAEGIVYAHRIARNAFGLHVVADESFLNESDARVLARSGVWLNMKIQKLGGIRRSLELERLAVEATVDQPVRSLVGGTFPTAIGRCYDQHAASVLRTVSLPCDGWQPASDWFTGARHLIHGAFQTAEDGRSVAFAGEGLGAEPDWEKIVALRVPDPEDEYGMIRTTGSGRHLTIERGGEGYPEMYERLTGRSPWWNIVQRSAS
ncbi:hypothetical protein HY626_01560 [Candidatus Uhrbacteria bacterium]|nr:hypothetical protein [Candidatus Uhrbacteria bacterium]